MTERVAHEDAEKTVYVTDRTNAPQDVRTVWKDPRRAPYPEAWRDALVFPPGRHVVDTIVWRGQPIIGAGSGATTLVSRPGRDIVRGDRTASQYVTGGAAIRGVTFEVDDTADVRTADRGGVGNAGIAIDFPDGGAAPTTRLFDVTMDDVRFKSTSGTAGGRNGTAGIYSQLPMIQSAVRRLRFENLAYGLWEHHPTSNVTAIELAGDHNHYDTVRFYRCGDAMRLVNQTYTKLSNIVAHQSSRSSFTLAGVQSKIRSLCRQVSIDTMMLEAPGPTAWDLSGAARLVGRNISITGLTAPLTIAGSHIGLDLVQAVRDGGATPLLTLTGDMIDVRRMTAANRQAAVVDNRGAGNAVWAWEFFNEDLTDPVDLLA